MTFNVPCGADGWAGGRAIGRTYGHLITEISRMDRLPHFLRFEAKQSAGVELRYYATDNPRKGEMDK